MVLQDVKGPLAGPLFNLAKAQLASNSNPLDVSQVYDLNVKRWTMTLDRGSSPYATAQFVCVLPDAVHSSVIDGLADPRLGSVLRLDAQQNGNSMTSGYLGTGGLTGPPLSLQLRSRSIDWGTGEMTLGFASWELFLDDYMRGADWDPGASNYRAAAAAVMSSTKMPQFRYLNAETSINLSTLGTTTNPTTTTGSDVWTRNQTALDYCQQLAETANAWFFCDLAGQFWWADPTYQFNISPLLLNDASNILNVIDALDRADPLFSNSVQITYSPPSGTPAYAWAALPATVPFKAVNISRGGGKPAGAQTAVNAMANKGSNRGRTLTVTAVADLQMRPNQSVKVTYNGYTRTGVVRSVTFRMPEGLMDVVIDS